MITSTPLAATPSGAAQDDGATFDDDEPLPMIDVEVTDDGDPTAHAAALLAAACTRARPTGCAPRASPRGASPRPSATRRRRPAITPRTAWSMVAPTAPPPIYRCRG
jgi:hypothetical protein